jgi:serine/threonine protein kinase
MKKFAFFTVLMMVIRHRCTHELKDFCTENLDSISPGKAAGVSQSVSLLKAFTGGKVIGEGSYGLVKKVEMKTSGYSEIAIKRLSLELKERSKQKIINELHSELEVFKIASKAKFAPEYIGCEYTTKSVLIAQQMMDVKLKSPEFKKLIMENTPNKRFFAFYRIFSGLSYLHGQGLVHRDIKPDNMMFSSAKRKIYLIDFGLAVKNNSRFSVAGSPYFMPYGAFVGPQFEFENDYYAAALSIGTMVSETSKIFMNKVGSPLENSCFGVGGLKNCVDQITSNLKKVLKEAGFGEYQTDGKFWEMNFTTVLANMVNFKKQNMDHKASMKALRWLAYTKSSDQVKRDIMINYNIRLTFKDSIKITEEYKKAKIQGQLPNGSFIDEIRLINKEDIIQLESSEHGKKKLNTIEFDKFSKAIDEVIEEQDSLLMDSNTVFKPNEKFILKTEPNEKKEKVEKLIQTVKNNVKAPNPNMKDLNKDPNNERIGKNDISPVEGKGIPINNREKIDKKNAQKKEDPRGAQDNSPDLGKTKKAIKKRQEDAVKKHLANQGNGKMKAMEIRI